MSTIATNREVIIRFALMVAQGAPDWRSLRFISDSGTVQLEFDRVGDARYWAQGIDERVEALAMNVSGNRAISYFWRLKFAGRVVSINADEPWAELRDIDDDASRELAAELTRYGDKDA